MRYGPAPFYELLPDNRHLDGAAHVYHGVDFRVPHIRGSMATAVYHGPGPLHGPLRHPYPPVLHPAVRTPAEWQISRGVAPGWGWP